jgi:hypothetical protein
MLGLRARGKVAAEDGFAMMEVLVSAAVLVLVVLGILAGLDAVSRAAGGNQARTVAATLAELDQERLRGLPTGDLDKLDEIESTTRKVKVEKVDYTIKSEAQWVTDTTGTEISCSLVPGEGAYLRITSTVTSPITGAAVKPVVLSSIVAPRPGKGTLTAMVKNAAGNPVSGMGVQAVGPTPATKTTNSEGCAVFDESEAGSYVLKLNTTGWVDRDGITATEKGATVSAGNLTTVELLYDKQSSINVSVKTNRPGVAGSVSDRSTGITFAHTGLTTGSRVITSALPGNASFSSGPLFPFTTPYEVYSGTCTGNKPSPVVGATLTPGGPPEAVDVLEPAIDVTATYKNGSAAAAVAGGALVYAYPKSAGCSSSRIPLGTTDATTGKLLTNTDTGPGLPYGNYDVCVQLTRTVGGNSKTWRVHWSSLTGNSGPTIANTNPAGTVRTAAFVSSNSSTGGCGNTTPIS